MKMISTIDVIALFNVYKTAVMFI